MGWAFEWCSAASPRSSSAGIPVPAALTQNDRIGLIEGFEPDGQVRLLEAELGTLQVPPLSNW